MLCLLALGNVKSNRMLSTGNIQKIVLLFVIFEVELIVLVPWIVGEGVFMWGIVGFVSSLIVL